MTHTDDNVWVANSNTNNVTRLNSSGDLVKLIDPTINPDGAPAQYPTGVAVDAEGKVWVTFRYSHNAMRIDPGAGS